MKSLGRIALLCGWMTLTGCGPAAPSTDGTASTGSQNIEIAPPICPEVMPPECHGSLYPIYEGDCLIGFECVDGVAAAGKPPGPLCPVVMPPQCDGSLYPIYRGDCLIGFECVPGVTATALPGPTCPQPVPPGPGFCENGTISPVYDGKCIVRYTCTL